MRRALNNSLLTDQGSDNEDGRYRNPGEVLRDPKLSADQKRSLLQHWAFDAYRFEVATTEGMPPSVPSGLEEAIDALIDLDVGAASISKSSNMVAPKGELEHKQRDAEIG